MTDLRKRRVEMFYAGTPSEVKEHVINDMVDGDGNLRVLICTSAFGMGVNCKNISQIVHFGPPKSIESYVQECGRAGREGLVSKCYIIYNSLLLLHVTDEMKRFIMDRQTCRREQLNVLFQTASEEVVGCQCCDVCELECICDNQSESLVADFSIDISGKQKIRKFNEEEKKQLESLVRTELIQSSASQYESLSFPTTLFSFNDV